jgi:tetratricopeptide (TPR) repeat protein
MLIGSSSFVAIWRAETTNVWENTNSLTIAARQALAVPAPPPLLNKREQLYARMKVPVQMPPDLLATIEDKDPRLSQWIEAWQEDHLDVEQRDPQWLAPILASTPLGAGDLWRLCRQIDRGGVSDACRYTAAAAVRHAQDELASRSVTINTAYIDELSKLKPFLILGAGRDPQALEIWSELILATPSRDRTLDMGDSARLGLACAKFAEGDSEDASQLLESLKAETANRKPTLSQDNENELNYFLGNLALKRGNYAEALSDYDSVPHVDSDDAIYAMEYSAFALAHLGRTEDAKERIAEFVVRYHFDEDSDRNFSETFGDQLANKMTRISSGIK